MNLVKIKNPSDRRTKSRFAIQRELKYKVLKDKSVLESGTGQTLNIGSGGVAFAIGRNLQTDCYIELSISWPMLLDDTCPMRLVVLGRVLRSEEGRCACTIDKYEFRTQSRAMTTMPSPRADSTLQRWAESLRREAVMKSRAAIAV